MKTLEHGHFQEGAEDALSPGQVRDWTGDETYGSSLIPDGWKRSWNAPICERCWVVREGFQQPVRVRDTEDRAPGARCCAFCGRPTWAGILVRARPTEVPYPMLETIE